jgi:protein ImuA
MSQGGSSERVDFLRQKIAWIEAGCGLRTSRKGFFSRPSTEPTRVNLGENCSLDRMLQGGLCRGALHEIVPARAGDAAAASGFTLALAARFAAKVNQTQSTIIWIVEDYAGLENGAPYGPGLALHGIDPARLLLVHTPHAKESLWTMEEALKCRVAAVIAEIGNPQKAYDLIASRRLVLVAQKSGTPGLVLMAAQAAHGLSSSAQTRFEILSHAGLYESPTSLEPTRSLPQPGLASWSIRLLKARAGPAGLDFDRDRFFTVLWDHEEAYFRDAFPLPLAALSRHRPDRSADARARLAKIA